MWTPPLCHACADGCQFYELYRDEANGEQLLIAWLYSAGMRFIVNEPFLILASKGAPMLFESALCANCCSETIIAALSVVVEVFVTCLRALKAP